MKELSIEEKAQRYDNLLVKLQEAKVDNDVCDERYCCVIDNIVHEIVESEDDRIRKWLIGYFNQYIIDGMPQVFGNGLNVKDVIAWLEKQGEQNQETNYPKFDFDDILAIQYCMETAKKVTEDKELYEKLQSLHDRLHDAYWIGKQGEQKPANWLQELEDKLANATPQQIAEWKEKYFKEEPAWSEEDEKIVNLILCICSDFKKVYSQSETALKDADKIESFLESLKDRYTWKPSDEQMEALNEVVNYAANSELQHWSDFIYTLLKSLREQLKKLREE